MAIEDIRRARVALACLVEPGNRDLGRLLDTCGAMEALARVRRGDTSAHLAATVASRLASGDVDAMTEAALDRTERIGAHLVVPEDDQWPRQLDDLRRISRETSNRLDRDTYPPVCLWVRGAPPSHVSSQLHEASQRCVSIVGARASTAYGNHVALEFGYGLASRGWGVVSGGAFGIDAQAHRGALSAGGLTVAVLACGVDVAYPQAHASLFERIADEGLLLSEWPPGAQPHRHRFLIRNRVIAALTRGTVVVEASARSGARQTAGKARLLGRSTMAVPGPVTSAMSVGTHQILRTLDGRLVTSAAEVLEEVGRIGDDLAPVLRGPEHAHDRLDPTLAQVLDGVPTRPGADAAQIAADAGVPLRAVLRALPALRDGGFVVEDATGWRLALRHA